MKSSLPLGLILSLVITSHALAANNDELRRRCDSPGDANACWEVGLADKKLSETQRDGKAFRKAAQRELKQACRIKLGRKCSREETTALARAFRNEQNRIPATSSPRSPIRAPKITAGGKRASPGGAAAPAYEPQPAPEPPQPMAPPEPQYIPPPPPPMPPPPLPQAPGGTCMPGDASCMQSPVGMPMNQ